MENKRKRKETGNYIFPKVVADNMLKISRRTQMEAGLMSMSFILMGMIIMSLYIIIFTDFSIFFKVMTIINTMAGFIFIGSYLVTTFQQYYSYLGAAGIINDWNEPNEEPEPKEEKAVIIDEANMKDIRNAFDEALETDDKID